MPRRLHHLLMRLLRSKVIYLMIVVHDSLFSTISELILTVKNWNVVPHDTVILVTGSMKYIISTHDIPLILITHLSCSSHGASTCDL